MFTELSSACNWKQTSESPAANAECIFCNYKFFLVFCWYVAVIPSLLFIGKFLGLFSSAEVLHYGWVIATTTNSPPQNLPPLRVTLAMWSIKQNQSHSFIHSYIHTFIHTFIHTLIHTFIHTFILTFIHTYIHSYIHLFILSFIHSFNHSFHIYIHSFKFKF